MVLDLDLIGLRVAKLLGWLRARLACRRGCSSHESAQFLLLMVRHMEEPELQLSSLSAVVALVAA